VAVAQKFTSVPVEVVTLGTNSSMTEIIRAFNSYDVLITPEGGHLTNGIFTMNPNSKAVIEVASAVYEMIYYKNYILRLGFAGYIFSDGHLTPQANCPWHVADDFSRACVLDKLQKTASNTPNVIQEFYKCKLHNRKQMEAFRLCDLQVNVEKLEKSLEILFKGILCP